MKIRSSLSTSIYLIGALILITSLVQCTKDGPNAGLVSRALVEAPDSTVFSPFYDSVLFAKADNQPTVNDIIRSKGVLSIVNSNCASVACHGGKYSPNLTNYQEIKALVVPGNPEGSELFQMITTSDLQKAMPPINYGVDLSITDKTIIYNWIKNGATEQPSLIDFRPAAISLITNGCGSANCHNQATVGGEWARRSYFPIAAGDTVSYTYINPSTGSKTIYAQLKEPALSREWNAYKDSAKKFYADTVVNSSFRPYKTFSAPTTNSSRRGPLNSYDDILFDINYPKGLRSTSATGSSAFSYTDPVTLKKYYVLGDNFSTVSLTSNNPTSTMVSRIDTTLSAKNPRKGMWNKDPIAAGNMAWDDGGLTPSEIAIIKSWYFADPNIPDAWKYGLSNEGIFRYNKSQKIILK